MNSGESQPSTNTDNSTSSTISKWRHSFKMKYQYYLDKSTPHILRRWIAFALIFIIYAVRVYVIQGFYIITYGLGIFVLNLLIGFLSPQVDPEMEGPSLPTRGSDEFRPFVRRLPEFKFWYAITMAFCIAFVLTFFDALDVPVFWPILLMYWLILFLSTMKRQLMHMVKYKYVPFSVGKQQYSKKRLVKAEEAEHSYSTSMKL